MAIVCKEVEVEVEVELDDFDTEDLIEELNSRPGHSNTEYQQVDSAWWDMSTTGIPAEVVLHDLFKDCSGYDFHKLQSFIKNN